MAKLKLTKENYWKPTPPNIRKAADAVLATTTVITASSIAMSHPAVAIGALSLGAAAKFFSNFFAD